MNEFEERMDAGLKEMANPEPPMGMEVRVMSRVAGSRKLIPGRRFIWGAVAASVLTFVVVAPPVFKPSVNDRSIALSGNSNQSVSHERPRALQAELVVPENPRTARKQVVHTSRLPRDSSLQVAPLEIGNLRVEPIGVASLTLPNELRKVDTR